jgi:hypothetical protein
VYIRLPCIPLERGGREEEDEEDDDRPNDREDEEDDDTEDDEEDRRQTEGRTGGREKEEVWRTENLTAASSTPCTHLLYKCSEPHMLLSWCSLC